MACDSIGFTLDFFLDGDNAHPRVIKRLPGDPGKQCSKPSPKSGLAVKEHSDGYAN